MSARRPGAWSRLERRRLLEAARRVYVGEEKQAVVAEDLGISPSYFARILKGMREDGDVRIFVNVPREDELATALRDKFPSLVHVDVVERDSDFRQTAANVATALAWWFNDLLDRDERADKGIRRVAIGGAMPHRLMVDMLTPRANRISVGPTALTNTGGAKHERHTAPMVAFRLAECLGAVREGSTAPAPANREGFFYDLRLDPPHEGAEMFAAWWEHLEKRPDYQEMVGFWTELDVVFVSAVGVYAAYPDTRKRLAMLGTSVEDLERRGAVAFVANQAVTADGQLVPLLGGIPTYEPAVPIGALKAMVAGAGRPGGRRYVALDLWGEIGEAALALLRSGLVNVLVCDQRIAEKALGDG